MKNIYTFNTTLIKAFGPSRTTDQWIVNRTDDGKPTDVSGAYLYQSGYLDESGSLPCSVPGAAWIYNSANVTTSECELRSNHNMIYCPPVAGANYRTLTVTTRRGYTAVTDSEMEAEWECGRRQDARHPRGSQSYTLTVRTDKRYYLDFNKDNWADLEFVGNNNFEGQTEIVVRKSGKNSIKYFNLPSNVAGTVLAQSCKCNTTWILLRLPPRVYNVTSSSRVYFTVNNTISCPDVPDCSNPYPIPAAANCAPIPVVASKNESTCSRPSVPQDQLGTSSWWPRPYPAVRPVPSAPFGAPPTVSLLAPRTTNSGTCVPVLEPTAVAANTNSAPHTALPSIFAIAAASLLAALLL